jgi:hypothetical protein
MLCSPTTNHQYSLHSLFYLKILFILLLKKIQTQFITLHNRTSI